jgi:hypothetical protein
MPKCQFRDCECANPEGVCNTEPKGFTKCNFLATGKIEIKGTGINMANLPVCGRTNCHNVPSWVPVLVLPSMVGNGPARMILNLPICEEHKQNAKVDDFLSAEGLAQIGAVFESVQRKAPTREEIGLEFMKKSQGEAMIKDALAVDHHKLPDPPDFKTAKVREFKEENNKARGPRH